MSHFRILHMVVCVTMTHVVGRRLVTLRHAVGRRLNGHMQISP